jgi:hypothetical protein
MSQLPSLAVPCPSCSAVVGDACVTRAGHEAHSHVARKKSAARLSRALRGRAAGGQPARKIVRLPGDLAQLIAIAAARAGMSQRMFVRAAIEHYADHLDA